MSMIVFSPLVASYEVLDRANSSHLQLTVRCPLFIYKDLYDEEYGCGRNSLYMRLGRHAKGINQKELKKLCHYYKVKNQEQRRNEAS